MRKLLFATAWVASSAACASAEPPDTYLPAQVSIRYAEEVGAASVPAAAAHLDAARIQRDDAERLIAKGDLAEAERMLERAAADAALAEEIALLDGARRDAVQRQDRLKRLRRHAAAKIVARRPERGTKR